LRLICWLLMIFLMKSAAFAAASSTAIDSFGDGQAFLNQYCKACHQAKGAGGFDVQRLSSAATFGTDTGRWLSLIARVKNKEMPPQKAPAPPAEARDNFVKWAESAFHAEVCSAGLVPAPAPIRRLNREEYTATVQYLLDLHLDVGHGLPADGAGGEGFDNAAEALVLSPLLAEKYLETAKIAVDSASKEFRSRRLLLVAKPSAVKTPAKAAHEILAAFLPRAFRRPVSEAEIAPFLNLFAAAQKQGQAFESAIFLTLQGVLISPKFLFHLEPQNNTGEIRPLEPYALASRLSYFLWGTMPDPLLTDLAAQNRLNEPGTLKALTHRMLQDERSTVFAERFVGQWLRTQELGANKIPDAKMFPGYSNEELRSDIGYQPVLFFRELMAEDLSLLNLIDSKYTVLTSKLAQHYKEPPVGKKPDQQPQWLELQPNSQRGGLLGMAAVLAVSSYPHRTSPVLRGAWVLESMLGTPPPPPPPNVPALPEDHTGAQPTSVRARLEQHRANPACAGCHSRIDPLGFALENFDALGGWRTEDGGKPVDTASELADGTKLGSPADLKDYLLDRKDLVVRNLTNKMLGYALGRALTPMDSCIVDDIMKQVKQHDYSAQTLVEAVVLSAPFRYQAPSGVVRSDRATHVAVEGQKQ
jgi:hypothetical protein